MITLPDVEFCTKPVTKCYTADKARAAGGPEGLLATLTPFKGGSSMHAHRYNGGQFGADATRPIPFPPPSGGGKLPPFWRIPATAVYVVWSYNTPIAWVELDGTVTIPDVYYSSTTRAQQNKCRAWLGAAVPGTTTHAHHVAEGYRTA